MEQKTKKKLSKKQIAARVGIALLMFAAVDIVVIGWRFSFGPFAFIGESITANAAGNADEYDMSTVEPLADSPLEGKTVLFLGSSVTRGAKSQGQSLADYTATRLGANVIKEAVDGTTLVDNGSSSYIQRMIANVDTSQQIDLVVVQLSTNDATKGMPLGEIGDGTDTITGAMEYIASYAKQTWGCPVVFYTNTRYEGGDYESMVSRAKELAERGEIGLIDLWSSDEFNDITDEQRSLYMNDRIHPFKAGYRDWWGPEFERQLLAWWAQQ